MTATRRRLRRFLSRTIARQSPSVVSAALRVLDREADRERAAFLAAAHERETKLRRREPAEGLAVARTWGSGD